MFWTDYNHESKQLDLNVNPDASVSSECSTEREDLEFQENAAAALLELQRRSSFPKWLSGNVITLKMFDGTKTSLGFVVLNSWLSKG